MVEYLGNTRFTGAPCTDYKYLEPNSTSIFRAVLLASSEYWYILSNS